MILDPFNAALHTLRDLRDAAASPALARSRKATLILADHTEQVIKLLEKVDHAHADERVSRDIATRLERMEGCLMNLTKLLHRLAGGTTLRGLLWRDEIQSRIAVAYTTLEDAIDKLDPDVKANLAELFKAQSKDARKEDARNFINAIQGSLHNDEDAIEFLQIRTEEMNDAMLSMQKRVSHLADERVSMLFARALRACQAAVNTPPLTTEPDRFALSALELVLHEDEIYGTRGRVYGADWLGTRVAVRLLPRGFPTDVINRVTAKWKTLQHSNILSFIGAGTLSNPPFIAHAFASNGPILSYLAKNAGADRMQLAMDIVTGLSYLHSVHVPHGDLRAANVLVNARGRACLADYAAGPLRSTGSSPRDQDESGSRPRPTRWMSPEVMRGQRWDEKADMYSLGMTLYEIFTGHQPLVDVLRSELFALVHRGERPARPSSGSLAENDTLWNVLSSCWGHQPGDRPAAETVTAMFSSLVKSRRTSTSSAGSNSYRHSGNGRTLPVPPGSRGPSEGSPLRRSKLPEWTPLSEMKASKSRNSSPLPPQQHKRPEAAAIYPNMPRPRNPSPPPPEPFRRSADLPRTNPSVVSLAVSSASAPTPATFTNDPLPGHLLRLALDSSQPLPHSRPTSTLEVSGLREYPEAMDSRYLDSRPSLRTVVSQPHLRCERDVAPHDARCLSTAAMSPERRRAEGLGLGPSPGLQPFRNPLEPEIQSLWPPPPGIQSRSVSDDPVSQAVPKPSLFSRVRQHLTRGDEKASRGSMEDARVRRSYDPDATRGHITVEPDSSAMTLGPRSELRPYGNFPEMDQQYLPKLEAIHLRKASIPEESHRLVVLPAVLRSSNDRNVIKKRVLLVDDTIRDGSCLPCRWHGKEPHIIPCADHVPAPVVNVALLERHLQLEVELARCPDDWEDSGSTYDLVVVQYNLQLAASLSRIQHEIAPRLPRAPLILVGRGSDIAIPSSNSSGSSDGSAFAEYARGADLARELRAWAFLEYDWETREGPLKVLEAVSWLALGMTRPPSDAGLRAQDPRLAELVGPPLRQRASNPRRRAGG